MKTSINSFFKKLNNEKYGKYLELIPNFKKERAQKFTTVVLTIVAVIILAIFAINPTLSTIANLQKQLEDAKFVTDKLDQKINNLSILQTKYETLREDLPIIYEAIPKSSEVPKFTGQLQALAKENNLAIVNAQIADIDDSSDYSHFSFNISLRGKYQDILSFLDRVKNIQRIIDIEGINIAQASEEQASVLQLSLNGRGFFKK